MSTFYGFKPGPSTRQAVEKFENNVMIRHNNQMLVGSVYVDMQDTRWAVAFAYNMSRHPGLHGHEHALEVKYSYMPGKVAAPTMFRSDSGNESLLASQVFADQDAFVNYVINCERTQVNQPT